MSYLEDITVYLLIEQKLVVKMVKQSNMKNEKKKPQISPAQFLSSLPETERNEYLESLSDEAKGALKYHWEFWARPDQLCPEGEEWTNWLILAGRGWGKTRCGSETIRKWVEGSTPLAPGNCSRIALIGETAADGRDVMVEGESGILACSPKDFRPEYKPSLRKLVWPNGAVAHLYNATEPDQLRGPQHDAAWCDELAKWQYAQETWDQLQFGLRLGDRPRCIITTTPRPLPLIKNMLVHPLTTTTRGSTRDNMDNLAAPFISQIEERYKGTRLGRQELDGEVLDDIPGALWTRSSIEEHRKTDYKEDMQRIVVAIDPAASSGEGADETGIVAAGISKDKDNYPRGYVLADRSINGTPEEWAKRAVSLYRELNADKIIAEKNNGGEMIEAVIRAVDPNIPIELVHASRGKHIRAEPISALYEQGRIHHTDYFPELEEQMCEFSPDNDRAAYGSPDRMDALVWAFTSLFDNITKKRYNNSDSQKQLNEIRHKEHLLNSVPTGWMGI